MKDLNDTVSDVGLKACIAHVKKLWSQIVEGHRLIDNAIERLLDLMESPIGIVEEVKLQLDYQYAIGEIIKNTMQQHLELDDNMRAKFVAAYEDWQEKNNKRKKELDGILDLRPHD